MPGSVHGGGYIYYYDFPSQLDFDFVPLPLKEKYPTITSEDDQYSIESTRYSEYVSTIKTECADKMAWVMSSLPAALESLEDVICLKQLCNYLNTSDFWKKDDDWPEQVNDEQLRAFNIEVVRNWLFHNTARHFYVQNQGALPSFNEYTTQMAIQLEQMKKELLALDALYLMNSHLNSYLVGLWESFNSGSSLNKFNVFNVAAITEMIKEKELLPDLMQLNIHSDDFEHWQRVHRELVHELLIIINCSILNELKKKCAAHGCKIPFELLYAKYWPTSKRLDDYTSPLRSLSEINQFMEKIAEVEQERFRIIEEKRKRWNGSPAGFEVAMERTQAILMSTDASNEKLMQVLSEQLEKIAAEDEVVQSLSLVNKNPIEIVKKILHAERVDEVAKLAPVIVRDIQHVIEHMPDKPTSVDHSKNLQALDQFVVGVRSACNRAALIDLYDRLEQSTNKQIAEKIIGDWDVVGTDIRDSERMLTESDKLRIIAYAQGKMTKEEYTEEMSKLNIKLERGEITAQEEVVIKMFPKLKQALARLPKEYLEDFSLVLKRAFVHQQITHPEKFLQNPHETAVFTALGLDSGKVKVDKELVQQKIKHVIQNVVLNGQSENEFPTLKELQYQIELMALKEKISAAGGDPSLAPLIHTVTKARQKVLATATLWLEQEYERCRKELNDDKGHIAQHIDSSLKQSKSKLLRSISRAVNQNIKKSKDSLTALKDEYNKVIEMISPLNDQSCSTFHAELLKDVQKDIEFFNQWGDPIQYENIQGFIGGIGEVLGDGVCQANTYRVITQEMTTLGRNQFLSDAQWKTEVKISPQDRYNQALYQVDAGDEKNNGLSKAVLKRLHLKKIQALHKDFHYADEPAFGSDSIYQILFQAVNEQKKSKFKNFGIVKLSIGHHATNKDGTQATDQATWGHAIYLRYDPKKKTAYFYDPNHGRSINFYTWKKLENDADFKKMGQKEQDEVVLNYMLLCFSQMMTNDFNDINTVKCYEMEMDFSFIDKLVSAGNKVVGGLNNFFKKKKEPDMQIKSMTVSPMVP